MTWQVYRGPVEEDDGGSSFQSTDAAVLAHLEALQERCGSLTAADMHALTADIAFLRWWVASEEQYQRLRGTADRDRS